MAATLNDIYFAATLLEAVARTTKNRRRDVVERIGKDGVYRIVHLADILHALPMEQAIDETIEQYRITDGTYDSVSACKYDVPRIYPIGKDYMRLVRDTEQDPEKWPEQLYHIFLSPMSDLLSDFNSAWFFSPAEDIAYEYRRMKI